MSKKKLPEIIEKYNGETKLVIRQGTKAVEYVDITSAIC